MRVIKDCDFVDACPICGSTMNGDAVLIGVAGTEDGGNIQACLFHVDCLNLIYYPGKSLVASVFRRVDDD